MTTFIFVDVETTGLDPDRHPIWEVALLVHDDKHPLADYQLHWQVQLTMEDLMQADHRALELTGFWSRYDHHKALTPVRFVEEFAASVPKGAIWVGNVPSFDEERIRRMMVRYMHAGHQDMPWHYQLIDVEVLAAGRHMGKHEDFWVYPLSTESLIEELDIQEHETGVAHTALADALMVKLMWNRLHA